MEGNSPVPNLQFSDTLYRGKEKFMCGGMEAGVDSRVVDGWWMWWAFRSTVYAGVEDG